LGQQLSAYASGLRFSGIMQTAVAGLDEENFKELANYFAEKKPDQQVMAAPDASISAELGWKLANTGLFEQGLPACFSCHSVNSAKRDAMYPAIAGQPAPFTSEQLVLFKLGTRGSTPETAIMNVIAQRMTADQIAAVSKYLEQAGSTQAAP
jgi:cytochrome c553